MDSYQLDSRQAKRLAALWRRWVSDVSAKGATHSLPAWGSAPRFRARPKESALKARFTFRNQFHPEAQVRRAFSARHYGNLNSWGDAPGWYERAPLALHALRTRCSCHAPE